MERMGSVAGLIEAAASEWEHPLSIAGSISALRRVVLTYRQADIFPTVVLTGENDEDIRANLADAGVIFLRCEASEPIQAVVQGLRFLSGKADRVVYTPVNMPFFTADTILRLLEREHEVVIPSCNGKSGHPIVLSASTFPAISDYHGREGLRGALHGLQRQWVEVADEGILQSVRDEGNLDQNARIHSATLVQPVLHLGIGRDTVFYDARVKLLLYLLSDTENLRQACGMMQLSVGKAWNLLNRLERELGYPVVQRRQGGRGGGKTSLTPQGIAFTRAADTYEQAVRQFAQQSFQSIFQQGGIL